MDKEKLKSYETTLSFKIRSERENGDLYRTRASIRLILGSISGSMLDYSDAIRINPQDHEAYKGRGNVHFKLKMYNESIEDYTKSIELSPRDPEVYFSRGISHFRIGQFRRTIFDCTKSIELKPNSPDPSSLRLRGRSYRRIEEYEKSIQDLTRSIDILDHPDSGVYYERGVSYYRRREYENAILDFTKAIELDPTLPILYINRGAVHDEISEYKDAIRDYSMAIELNPRDPSVYINRGVSFNKLKMYDEAILDYTKALELDPMDSSVYRDRTYVYSRLYNNRGNAYRKLKKYDEAVQDLTNAISVCPRDPNFYKNRGVVFSRMRKYKDACADFSKSLELNPRDPEALNNRGNALGHLKEYERALQDFSEAIDLNPYYLSTYFNRGTLFLYSLGKCDEALTDFNECVRISPKDPRCYFHRGRVFEAMGENEKAKMDYETAREVDPDYERKIGEGFESVGSLDKFGEELVSLQKRLKSVRFHDLKVLRILGSGVYGRTYFCHVNGIDGDFVVKIYKDGGISTKKKLMELRERDSLYLEYHPNLVTILSHADDVTIDTKELPDYDDFWKDFSNVLEKVPMILMKLYPGDLDSFRQKMMDKSMGISILKICLILQGIINGARYLHENMIVHRDLHMGNILYDESIDRVWICDFGCALDLRENRGKWEVKKSDEKMFSYHPSFTYTFDRFYRKIGGVKNFRPPEIVFADECEDVDVIDYSKFDIYSIGIIGKELPHFSDENEEYYRDFFEVISRFVEERPKKRIDFREATMGIRKLIIKLQSKNRIMSGISGGREVVGEGESSESQDGDDDDEIQKAKDLSLQKDDDETDF